MLFPRWLGVMGVCLFVLSCVTIMNTDDRLSSLFSLCAVGVCGAMAISDLSRRAETPMVRIAVCLVLSTLLTLSAAFLQIQTRKVWTYVTMSMLTRFTLVEFIHVTYLILFIATDRIVFIIIVAEGPPDFWLPVEDMVIGCVVIDLCSIGISMIRSYAPAAHTAQLDDALCGTIDAPLSRATLQSLLDALDAAAAADARSADTTHDDDDDGADKRRARPTSDP